MKPEVDVVRHEARWFEPTAGGLAPLIEAIGDSKVVLLGEASHGTRDFYRTRAELTKALLVERGFNFVAVEADWPDAYRVNRWVRDASSESGPEGALVDFTRFPRWMWRNQVVEASPSGCAGTTGGPEPVGSTASSSIARTSRSISCSM